MSEDEAILLLMSGASPAKKAHDIRARGIDSAWTDEFRARLGRLCIESEARSAIEELFRKHAAEGRSPAVGGFTTSPAASDFSPHENDRRGAMGNSLAGSEVFPANTACASTALAAPDQRLSTEVIDAFLQSDRELNSLLNRYTYHESFNAKEIMPNGQVSGRHYQEWDVLFDDKGDRLERETAGQPDTMTTIYLSPSPSTLFQQTRPLAFPPESRSEYVFAYMDHVRLDEVSAYKFSVSPTVIDRRKLRFMGTIWIEDQDLALIKAEGVMVPDNMGLRYSWVQPHFVDFRSQLDGQHWFPVLTIGEISINGVRLHQAVKYSNYKRFGSTTKIKTLDPEFDNSTGGRASARD